ncbi:MAG: hypothetical protein ACQERS_01000 [Bacteroidota bacterium]
MSVNTKIILKSGKDQSVRRRHPWIFSGAINKINGEPAEGDNLPGLVVDVYNNVAVIQAHSAGMYYQRELLADILMSLMDGRITAVYDKSDTALPFKAGIKHKNGFLRGEEAGNIVLDPPAFAAAANVGRKVRVIHQLSQPADHPVNIFHPESEYLKGLVLHIE